MSDYFSLTDARIKIGDDVIVIIAGNGAEYEQEAIVINVPQGPGGYWEFLRPDGTVFAPNAYHSRFVGVTKRLADG